jgi:hypothetical protein
MTRSGGKMLAATALLSILLVPEAFAGEVFVGPGAACATIACGLDAANRFNANSTVTIFVAEGTYHEGPLMISRPKTRVIGLGPAKPKVQPVSIVASLRQDEARCWLGSNGDPHRSSLSGPSATRVRSGATSPGAEQLSRN